MDSEAEFRRELRGLVEAQRQEPDPQTVRRIAWLLQAARDKGFYPTPEKLKAALLR